MDEPRNRGSPRLQFTKEELEDSTLSKPIAKAEKAADKYEKAKGKIKKHYQLKLSREEMEASNVSSKASEELQTEESGNASSSADAANPFEPDREIRTDPNAPGVRNTREKPQDRQKPAQKSGDSRQNAESRSADPFHGSAQPSERAQRAGSASGHASKAESSIPTSEAGVKKKVYRLKFEEAQAGKPSRLSHPVQKTIKTAEDAVSAILSKYGKIEGQNSMSDSAARAAAKELDHAAAEISAKYVKKGKNGFVKTVPFKKWSKEDRETYDALTKASHAMGKHMLYK